MNVRVLKATYDLHNGVGLANVAEELVAKTLAGARAADQTGDVDKVDRGGDNLLRAGEFAEHGEPRVGHGHDPDIRVDCAEGIIGGLRLAGAGDGIKESGLANIGQTDDSRAEHEWKMMRVEDTAPGSGRTASLALVGDACNFSGRP